MSNGNPKKASAFPRVFWIANIMELFERGAYYGMNSVLAIYLTTSLINGGPGFSEDAVGFLQAIVYAVVYIVPILGGALSEKFGYRRMLILSFSLLSGGYFVTGTFHTYGLIFVALLFMAVGAGLFKPIISGTIARSTNESNSGFGFGIYYWMINLGAFLAPIVVNILRGSKAFAWNQVFMASALYTAVMLIPAIFLFKDPQLPGRGASLKTTFKNALIVLGDARFMLMIFIYSIFWILYFQNFGTILWYLRDFINTAAVNGFMRQFIPGFTFSEELATTISAGTIILLQIVVSRLVKNSKPIPTMCSGMLIGSLSFLFLLFVFAIGEMTAHPKYYSYIGMIAPQDRKAVYMGYSFLYGVIGSLFGSSIGAALYTQIAKPGNPTLFFLIFCALGLLGFAGLLWFNRRCSQDTPAANGLARKVLFGIYLALTVLAVLGIIRFSMLQNYKSIFSAGMILLISGGGIIMLRRRNRE
ncbi:MAG: MFS transporter [Acidobacteria bacterium]|nr:MFS transporter [Acidobacteriota bacterium]